MTFSIIERNWTEATLAPPFGISLLPICQATNATFPGLFFDYTLLCFVEAGAKRVFCPINGELNAESGDLLVFPSGTVATLENRPVPGLGYRAAGIFMSDALVDLVFAEGDGPAMPPAGVQLLRGAAYRPADILQLFQQTVSNPDLPPALRKHRLLEPLVWLRENGIRIPRHRQDSLWHKLRRLIETDITHEWRVQEVAASFAMSEATFRRSLAKAGSRFSQVLLNTRLENGLMRLQSTGQPIAQIALDCGFKTPSHFSESFRKRFGIAPKSVRIAKN